MKRPASPTSNAKKVAKHYNTHKQQTTQQRKFSNIFELRKFNNWIKSCLIMQFIVKDAHVLDLGCGKGGDLRKFYNHNIEYYMGIDIADQSIQDNIGRYKEMRQPFNAKYAAFDCFAHDWRTLMSPNSFDLISSQFCFHYAFESKTRVKNTLYNISQVLKSGGYWIATIPNEDVIINRLQNATQHPNGRVFGNYYYNVRIEKQWQSVFGRQYHFTLNEAVEECPEYLVPWDAFMALANEFNLELIYKKTFDKMYSDGLKDAHCKDLYMRIMKMGLNEPVMDDEQWEVATFYQAFVMRKK
eukprot:NODE_1059_length_2391_cov_1.255672.p1 type:complete len:299 gc:universal NODE_1059_length_2391_cov_1.255672:2136-1240(-)